MKHFSLHSLPAHPDVVPVCDVLGCAVPGLGLTTVFPLVMCDHANFFLNVNKKNISRATRFYLRSYLFACELVLVCVYLQQEK